MLVVLVDLLGLFEQRQVLLDLALDQQRDSLQPLVAMLPCNVHDELCQLQARVLVETRLQLAHVYQLLALRVMHGLADELLEVVLQDFDQANTFNVPVQLDQKFFDSQSNLVVQFIK